MFFAGALAVVAVGEDARFARREAILQLRIERKQLRDVSDPFAMDPEHFRKYYRMPPQLVLDLLNHVHEALTPKNVAGVPPHLQLLCALRFYAEGGYQKGVGQDYEHPLSQTMVSRIIERVTNALVALSDEFIRFPDTRKERQRVTEQFQRNIRIPGILGLVDCFLVAFVRPVENEEAFYNYKGYHAMNVQVVSDANYIIQNVRICPGSNNDRYVWRHSDMKEHLESLRGNEAITREEGRYYLLGDSGYTPSPVLLTPIRHAPDGTPEARYTREHVGTRCKVEQLFGVLTIVWQCIKRARKSPYSTVKVAKLIMACAVLHNFRRRNGIIDDIPEVQINVVDADVPDMDYAAGIAERNRLINRYYR